MLLKAWHGLSLEGGFCGDEMGFPRISVSFVVEGLIGNHYT